VGGLHAGEVAPERGQLLLEVDDASAQAGGPCEPLPGATDATSHGPESTGGPTLAR
jgi:hypothetical protein